MELSQNLISIKGIGPKTVELFSKLNVYSCKDLLLMYPRTYLSYEEPYDSDNFELGKRVAMKGTIQSYVEIKKIRSLVIVSCIVKVGNKSVKLNWFHSSYLKKIFHIGQTYIFVGAVNIRNHQLVMEHPEYYSLLQYNQMLKTLQPIYPLTEGLSNKMVMKAMNSVIKMIDFLKDDLPEVIREKYHLLTLKDAIANVHFPKDLAVLNEARRRLIFDEFFHFLLRMQSLSKQVMKIKNQFKIVDWTMVEEFTNALGFELTDGQKEAILDIQRDMSSQNIMNRLVQGDVGSGKTVVAECALLAAAKNGFQAAFMVPTEVLAIQHYEDLCKHFSQFGLQIALLCGSTRLSEKRKIYERLAIGEIDIIVGTHALIQDKVDYYNLGLVITDEQHRFGVRQRELFAKKGGNPHVLVMSATPIPRTLGIIIYGDLDVSIIKDLPSTRKSIKNCVVGPKYRPTAYKFMQEQISLGHQIYIICPMVEFSENIEAENVLEYAENLKDFFANDIHIGILHGKMSPDEKNKIMKLFSDGMIDILVSTTVIEVGINNPNATVMMIENAERFGLAQLHQLRGRVGRGEEQSYCIMLCSSDQKEAQERLNILNKSNDGFYIANEDLKLRGPGDFFGIRQSGDVLFQLGDIYNHADILKDAKEAVDVLEKMNYSFDRHLNHQIQL